MTTAFKVPKRMALFNTLGWVKDYSDPEAKACIVVGVADPEPA